MVTTSGVGLNQKTGTAVRISFVPGHSFWSTTLTVYSLNASRNCVQLCATCFRLCNTNVHCEARIEQKSISS